MAKMSRSRSLVRARKRRQGREHKERPHSDSGWQCPRAVSIFERFVENQELLDPSELPSFFGALRRALPTNFRVLENQGSVEKEWQRLVRDYRLEAWPVPGISGAWQLQPDRRRFYEDGMPPVVRSWLV